MPTSACITQYFNSPPSMVPQSGNILLFNTKVTSIDLTNNGRPFIPLYGLKKTNVGGTLVYEPLTVAQNQNANALIAYFELANECYKASVNYAEDNIAAITQMTDPPYRDYLYKKLRTSELSGATEEFQRFQNIYILVRNFWANADPAWTNAVYQQQLRDFTAAIFAQAEKTLYLPPSLYKLDKLSNFGVAWLAWQAAVPALVAMYGLEINGGQ